MRFKYWLIGNPLHTVQAQHEQVSVFIGLGAFASDAVSSVAYATEEMLLVLVLVSSAVNFGPEIAALITGVMLLVIGSYYQTVHAYPAGGGAYNVARENLGVYPSLVAGAALVVDYVLTVAVSVAAGIAAITSAIPDLYPHRVALALGVVTILTLVNLRGLRESGRLFALPTYVFIACVLWVVGAGMARWLTGGAAVAGVAEPVAPVGTVSTLGVWLLVRAFASGCVALTGVEAIANTVPAFKEPAARRAGVALIWLGVILASLFIGITFLAFELGIRPRPDETVLSQLGTSVFGPGLPYALLQISTALILLLAANTCYTGFPRMASLLGRDKFLPKQLAHVGDRLVFSNGIVILGAAAALLLLIFQADTHALIPLYAVGVFLAFTISQIGMVIHWRRAGSPGWRWRAALNGIGALATGVVLIVVASAKFVHGAWVVLVVIPLLVWLFVTIHRHYRDVDWQLKISPDAPLGALNHTVVVPIPGITKPVFNALQYARSLSPRVRAVYVSLDDQETKQFQALWMQWNPGIELVVLEAPYRAIVGPLLEYLTIVEGERHDDLVTVVLPEFVPRRWWHHFLHNQTALLLKGALLFRKNIVVIDVPYHLHQ
ncbi:MAG: APC family permease [Nitrospirae bacterium]|nr:APC family permease [Nitrospirota bacterium]